MKTLDEIKQLMAAGETAQADEALKDLLAAEPDNLQAKMLYGTCRQLLGDEETFRRIHEDLASEMEKLVKEEPKAEAPKVEEMTQTTEALKPEEEKKPSLENENTGIIIKK